MAYGKMHPVETELLTECFVLIASAIFGATFNLATRVGWITIILGTPINGSLKIIILPSNNCFSDRNVLQNGVNALSKMVSKNSVFCPKAQILYFSDRTTRFGSNFASM